MSSEELAGEEKQTKGKVQQTGEQAVGKMKEVGQQVSNKAKTTVKQVTQQPETIAQPGRAENAASTSGTIIGAGLRKAANVIGGFAAGFQKGMRAGQPPKEAEKKVQQVQEEIPQSQQTGEASQTYVTEEEKIQKTVTKETE